jgi:hypothetical protein
MLPIALQIVLLDLQAPAVAAVLDQVLVPLVHPALRLALQLVLEIEDGNAVVAKASMLREDMIIKKRREIKKGKGKEIEIVIEIENEKKRKRKEIILLLISLSRRDAQGTISL